MAPTQGVVSRATDPTQSSGVGLGGEKHPGRKEVWPVCWACSLGLLNSHVEEHPTGNALPVVVKEIWDISLLYPKCLNASYFYMQVQYV